MSTSVNFLKTSTVYLAGSVLTKLVSLFLMPLYTAKLTPAEYGFYNVSSNIASVVIPFLAMEIWTGVLRFMLDEKEARNKQKYVHAGLSITLASMLLITCITLFLAAFFQIPNLGYIYLFCIVSSLNYVYLSFARGFGHSRLYAASGLLSSTVCMCANIVLIVHFHLGVRALFLGTILGLLAQVAAIEINVHALACLSPKFFDKQVLHTMLRFSAPLCFSTVCYWFSCNYSALVITNVQGLEENGLYSVAGKFTAVLSLFTQCFTLAIQEILYKASEGKENLYNLSVNYYFKFLSICTFAMIALIKAVFPFFVHESFSASLSFVPMYFLATFVFNYSIFLGNYFLKEKMTGQLAPSLLVSGVLNVAVIHLLIGKMGTEAANLSLLLAYIASLLIRLYQLRGMAGIKFDMFYMLSFAAMAGVTFAVFYRLGAWYNLLWACVLGLILLFYFRGYVGPICKSLLGRFSRNS